MKQLALAIRFLLELSALAAFAYWGFETHGRELPSLLFGLGAPLAAGLVWGAFVAPKARWKVPWPVRLTIEAAVFAAAALALDDTHLPHAAFALIALWALDKIVLIICGEA